MKKYIFLLIALAFILVGCDERRAMEYHSPADFADISYHPIADCGFGSPVKPTNLAPGGEEVITDPSPDLTWDFSGCDVYSFTVNVTDEPGRYLGNIVHDDVLEDVRSFEIDEDYLEDCTTYYWYVAGWGSADYYSDVSIFRTDFDGECPPVEACTGAPPMPIPFLQAHSGPISISTPQLLWYDSEPGCEVENYHYEVSTSPDFSEIILEGDTTNHSVEPEEPYLFIDCVPYFFRVTAEANGYSRTSDILEFQPYLSGGCMYYVCSDEQLTAPVLVFPAEGSTVTDLTPQFVWDYDFTDCRPHHFNVEVTTTPDFTYNLWHTQYYQDVTWTPNYEGNFSNCTKYYWRVTVATQGESAMVHSDIGTFYTNFGNTICGLTDIPHIPEEMLREFGLGCVSSSKMWAIFDFLGPVFGEYEVRVGNRTWPCELMPGTNNKLVCSGALATQGMETPVELFLRGVEEPVMTQEGTTPQCAGVTICQPPAEGCSPKMMGYDPLKQPIYVPTFWDSNQCACVPK